MSKKLLVVCCVLALLGVGTAFAQERNKENYPLNGGNYGKFEKVVFERIDKEKPGVYSHEANVSYITVGTSAPYYVAPSLITHPDWNQNTGVVQPKSKSGEDLKFVSTWSMELKPPASTSGIDEFFTVVFPDKTINEKRNRGVIEAKKCGEWNLVAKENPVIKGFECMSSDDLPEFKLRIVTKPKIGLKGEKQLEEGQTIEGLSAREITGYDVTGLGSPAFMNGKKVLLISTCNKSLLDGKQLHMYLSNTNPESWNESNLSNENMWVEENLRKFAFSIRRLVFKVKEDGNIEGLSSPTEASSGDSQESWNPNESKLKLTGPTVSIDKSISLGTFDNIESFRSIDHVYYLSSASKNAQDIPTGEQGGVISAISQRSSIAEDLDEAAQKYKTYPFGDYSIIVVRLTKAPITGPIYHIPNTLFAQ